MSVKPLPPSCAAHASSPSAVRHLQHGQGVGRHAACALVQCCNPGVPQHEAALRLGKLLSPSAAAASPLHPNALVCVPQRPSNASQLPGSCTGLLAKLRGTTGQGRRSQYSVLGMRCQHACNAVRTTLRPCPPGKHPQCAGADWISGTVTRAWGSGEAGTRS